MLKEKIRQFMNGRYGSDELSLGLMIIAGICLILAAISRNAKAAGVFVGLLVILVIWSIYRMLSRKITLRERENFIYKRLTSVLSRSTKGFRESMADWWGNVKSAGSRRKNQKNSGVKMCLFTCPGCGVDVKIPANKGKIMVTCPKCGTEFERVS